MRTWFSNVVRAVASIGCDKCARACPVDCIDIDEVKPSGRGQDESKGTRQRRPTPWPSARRARAWMVYDYGSG